MTFIHILTLTFISMLKLSLYKHNQQESQK